ncbi:MAG: hypothetical protein ACJ705_06740, partial [Nitrososphaeraceae archaeon]
ATDMEQIGTMAPNKLFDEKIFLHRYSSSIMMEWRKLEEGIQAQEQAGKLKIMEKTLSIHTMKEDTEKKMYEPIQKYPAEQPSAGSDKQIHQNAKL